MSLHTSVDGLCTGFARESQHCSSELRICSELTRIALLCVMAMHVCAIAAPKHCKAFIAATTIPCAYIGNGRLEVALRSTYRPLRLSASLQNNLLHSSLWGIHSLFCCKKDQDMRVIAHQDDVGLFSITVCMHPVGMSGVHAVGWLTA